MNSDSAKAVAVDLIPNLPNEISELVLLRLPFPHFTLARLVSSQWNQTLSNPNFLKSKSNLSLSKPFLFVLASRQGSILLQWQALDLESRRWFFLPSMPVANASLASLACAADRERGEIYVVGGMKGERVKDSVVVYSAANNSWRFAKGRMRGVRSLFAVAVIGGKVYVVGRGEGMIAVERYDLVSDRWDDVAAKWPQIARYDATVIGKKMLLTEKMPPAHAWMRLAFPPRGRIYDADLDAWEEMSFEMWRGWTGASTVVGSTLFMLPKSRKGRANFYNPHSHTWAEVSGRGIPSELCGPYTVVGAEEGMICIVGKGLDVGVGSVVEEDKGMWRVEWEVVRGPTDCVGLTPCNAQLLYA